MRTFKLSGVDSVLRDIEEEERCNERIRHNSAPPSDMKKKRLSALKQGDKRKAYYHAEVNAMIDDERAWYAEWEKEEGDE
jgi:hypothetical protein